MTLRSTQDLYEIKTATNDKQEAYDLAETLIKEGIAGAQITRVKSVYQWEGRLIKEYEWLVVFKVHKEDLEKVATRIKELHSYEVPEIVVTRILQTTDDFANWVKKPIGDSNG